MAAELQQVDERACSGPDQRLDKVFLKRVYNIPANSESLIPNKGDAVTLRSLTKPGTPESGSGITAWRVYSLPARQKTTDGWRVTIIYYQVRLYA